MLGIIFTGGDGPDTQFINQLLETQSPLIIAADSGLTAAEKAGLKPDWIIGDMDSLDDVSRLDFYPQERIIRMPHDKDYTDTELAFSLAVKQSCDNIWIIGGGGGRIEHLFAIRSMFERDIFPKRWITDAADIYCICGSEQLRTAGNNEGSVLCCSLEIGAVVSVFPVGGGPWEAESTGLKWQLAGLPWERGFFGLSNVATDGKFSINAKKGRFMIVLDRRKICQQL